MIGPNSDTSWMEELAAFYEEMLTRSISRSVLFTESPLLPSSTGSFGQDPFTKSLWTQVLG